MYIDIELINSQKVSNHKKSSHAISRKFRNIRNVSVRTPRNNNINNLPLGFCN